ncbi:MAG TPA: thiol peroxidase [Candidatus Dormibacteraeota bacterium]|nr:thiol peroxidase [Candidatus Dormibacteraeota bacterium]
MAAVVERENAFLHRTGPLTALGRELRPGEPAPDAELAGRGFRPEPIRISDFRGRVLILSTVPSLDTPTCDRETRRWEQERLALGDAVAMLTVSMDLPFAQERWCGAAEVGHTTASAYRNRRFGVDYGVAIKENDLLGRAVFVIDPEGVIRHVEYVRHVGTEPDYGAALEVVRGLLHSG